MLISRRLIFVNGLLFSVGGMLSGCGGGSSSGHRDDEDHSATQYPLSVQTRTLQVGDRWAYDNGQVYTIGQTRLNGVPVLTRVVQQFQPGGEAPAYLITLVAQTAEGEVASVGERIASYVPDIGPELTGTSGRSTLVQRILFGTWQAGSRLSYQIYNQNSFDPDTPIDAPQLEIVGTEIIVSRAGTFNTWKVRVTPSNTPALAPSTGTYWYAPQLGNFVRAEMSLAGGSTEAMILTSTNVSLTPAASAG